MTAKIFQPISARPAPVQTEGVIAWTRVNLFGDRTTALMTIVIGTILLYVIPQLLSWAIFRAFSWLSILIRTLVKVSLLM